MKIKHETSPANALSILSSGKFYGGVPGLTIDSDNGLNAIPLDIDDYIENQATFRGAIMIFEWIGPVLNVGLDEPVKDLPYPTPPNCLYVQKPNRVFVPRWTTEGLSLCSITFAKRPSGLNIFFYIKNAFISRQVRNMLRLPIKITVEDADALR